MIADGENAAAEYTIGWEVRCPTLLPELRGLASKQILLAQSHVNCSKQLWSPCIPSKANRKVPIPYDPALYRQRYKIEHMFGGLNEWRRIHT